MMSGMLAPGEQVRTVSSDHACLVEDLLGAGGQGEVYRCNVQGSPLALKWYYAHTATDEQRATLRALIDRGAPNARFLWPIELVTADSKPGFGYLMPLREPRFKGVNDLLVRRVTPTFLSLATAGVHLADGFLQLHARGLCYRDISQANVFFDPGSGEILICDNDNVGLDRQPGGVIGTPRFMAPEVVRGDASPSTQTDLFSLAVLLFLMFMNAHPLDGQKEAEIHCFDLNAMTRLYGLDPLFIFDPADNSNRPVPGFHDNAIAFWPIYPTFFRDLFTRSFTEGIKQPGHGRIRETTWRSATSRLRDSIMYCGCGVENFYDADMMQPGGGIPPKCWKCGQQLQVPPRIKIGKSIIMLNYNSKLFGHHLDDATPFDFSNLVAEVSRHPADTSRWGLRNLTKNTWTATVSGGAIRDVEPGKTLSLAAGTKIHFGKVDGEIRM